MALVYDQPTESLGSGVSSPTVQNESGEAMQKTGRTLIQAGNTANDIVMDYHNTIDTAMVKEMDNRLADNINSILNDQDQGFLYKTGKDALDSKEAAQKAIQESIEGIKPLLQNDIQKSMFGRVARDRVMQAENQIIGHSFKEAKNYDLKETKGRLERTIQSGVNSFYGWKDKGSSYETNKKNVIAGAEDMARAMGAGPEETEQIKLAATTKLHTDVINQMKSQNLGEDAKEYFNEMVKRGEIDPEQSDDLREKVDAASLNTQADTLASQAFVQLGPKKPNDAVMISDMEEYIRKQAGSNEELQEKAIAGVKARAASFNAQQQELRAVNIGKVWDAYDAGTPMTVIENSEAWDALTGTERNAIKSRIEADAQSKSARRLSEAQRILTEQQIAEKLLFNKNGDKFLTATDPEVLKDLTRDDVKALRSTFGQQATEFLLNKWENLQKPEKVIEAKMDQEDFYTVATSQGLDPFSKNQRDRIADLKFHVEQVIDLEQRKKGNVPLTRKEKLDLVNKEISKKVMVYRPIMPNVSKSVLLLTPEEKKKIVVPDDKKAAIAADLQQMYNKTKSPLFEPTPENVRKQYLIKISPASVLDLEESE
jgi:hypothetical protein